jgi:osmoprotectant transport system substrate-binding protein
MMHRFAKLIVALLVALAFSFSVAQSSPIRIGSKQFTESIVLAKIIKVALEDAGFEIDDRTPLGGSDVNRAALLNAEIDVYPEYTGTALGNYLRNEGVDLPEGLTQQAEEGYRFLADYDLETNGLAWLAPAPANNTYAFAVTRALAEEHGLASVADLARYVNEGNFVMMATGDEFAQRPDGIAAFERTYGFELRDDQLLIIAGGTPAQTEQALAEGANQVNVAMAFATDGALAAYDFVVLEDPLGAQPVFQPAPVFRAEVLDANPSIRDVLDPIFASLDNATLQELNARVDVDGENPEAVARSYVQQGDF